MVKTVHRLGPGMTAVVTGAAGGLGRAIGRALAERGVTVLTTDAPGVEDVERPLDVTDAAAVRAFAADADFDVWVNNAGAFPHEVQADQVRDLGVVLKYQHVGAHRSLYHRFPRIQACSRR